MLGAGELLLFLVLVLYKSAGEKVLSRPVARETFTVVL